MANDFRSAVFQLCKKLMIDSNSIEIRQLMRDISVINDSNGDSSNVIAKPSHGDLAYISSHNNIQFLGYLLTDDSVEEINKNNSFEVVSLNDDERSIIEMAYLTIDAFITECLKDIKKKFPKAYNLIHPYNGYKKPQIKTEATSFIPIEEMNDCVNLFKTGKLYKKLLENDTLYIYNNVSEDIMSGLDVLLDKQFVNDISNISLDTEKMINSLYNPNPRIEDLLYIYSVYCYALKKSLRNAIQLFYEAILGKQLLVLNNDNIIKIDGINDSQVYKKYSILCQNVLLDATCLGRTHIGSVILVNCEYSSNYHIKEFGTVISETINFGGEFGSSSKFSIITVDSELNPIHSLTDMIYTSELGKILVNYNRNK